MNEWIQLHIMLMAHTLVYMDTLIGFSWYNDQCHTVLIGEQKYGYSCSLGYLRATSLNDIWLKSE